MKYYDRLGVMLDCSRNAVMTVESLKDYISVISEMGYNNLQLYTEDTYEIDGEPYFGYLRGRYTKAELKEIVAFADGKGVEVVPCIQTLAHLNQIFRWDAYAEVRDTGDILLAGDDKTYALVDKMFKTLAECFTSRRVNIGMDEAHMLGLGRYLDKNGYTDRFEILYEHLKRVLKIADKYGFKAMMWSDMFFRLANHGAYEVGGDVSAAALAKVPDNVELVYWDYYSTDKAHYDEMLKGHKCFKNEIGFAGGAWTWRGFAPCNKFSLAATKAALASCKEHGIRDIFLTAWGDDGGECSPFSVLPTLMYAAEVLNGNDDEKSIKDKFYKITGERFDDVMLCDLPNAITEGTHTNDHCRYMLYNDCFAGIYDYTVKGGEGEKYAAFAEELLRLSDNKYGYIYKYLGKLCSVLEIKYEIGVKTRAAYKVGDKAGLKALADGEYTELLSRLEDFYNAFRAAWHKEKKAFGFEVQDARIGGLIRRVKNCRDRLYAYVNGEIEKIEELEEEILPSGGETCGLWKLAVSAGVI